MQAKQELEKDESLWALGDDQGWHWCHRASFGG